MKKTLINIALVLVILASLAFACVAESMVWIVALLPLYLSTLALVRINTDWIENY